MTQPSVTRPAPAQGVAAPDLAPVVLLAENDRTLRELFREILELDHFRVLTAANGQLALELAHQWVPDIVVTDVDMPRLDGFGLIRAVRCLYPGVPVIVTSGHVTFEGSPVEASAAELGAVATLTKPFDLADLHQVVRRVVLLDPSR